MSASSGEISGTSRSLRDFFRSDRIFEIGFYQREYRWAAEHVDELLTDLQGRFLTSWVPKPERTAAARTFPQYYLGTVVSAPGNGNAVALVDGQQRVTSLTLIFCALARAIDPIDASTAHLLRSLAGEPQAGGHAPRLRATDDDPLSRDRAELIEHLLAGTEDTLKMADKPSSILTMAERFTDIQTNLDKMDRQTLLGFADWLVDRVIIVEVATDNMQDAYEVFEAMNDRGLRLDSLDLMKGLLLAHIDDRGHQTLARVTWEKVMDAVGKTRVRDPRNVFVRSWLRGRYAVDEGDRSGPSFSPGDYKALAGDKYHRWVRENVVRNGAFDAECFVRNDLRFAADRFIEAAAAASNPTSDLTHVQYVLDAKPTSAPISYMMLMAVVDTRDDEATARRKMQLMAHYLDTYVAHRIAAGRPLSDSTVWPVFLGLAKQVRGTDLDRMARILESHAARMRTNPEFKLDRLALLSYDDETTDRIRWILARLTHAVDLGCRPNHPSAFATLVHGKKIHIEHLLPSTWDASTSPFADAETHATERSRLGGLVLLPAAPNMSLQDAPYTTKIAKYANLDAPALTLTLTPGFGANDPAYAGFLRSSGLGFSQFQHLAAPTVETSSLRVRADEYVALAKYVWDFGRHADALLDNTDWRSLDLDEEPLPAAVSGDDSSDDVTD